MRYESRGLGSFILQSLYDISKILPLPKHFQRGFRCRSIAKMNSNNKWKNLERSKKHKAETPEDSESPRGSVGQVGFYIHKTTHFEAY